jgi:hypothetical protein
MKYIIGVIGVVLVLIIAIFMIVVNGPESTDTTQKGGNEVVSLFDTARSNGTVRYTLEGRLVGEDQRRAIRISVNSNSRTIEVLKGYNEGVERSQTYGNTSAGFEEFLKALDEAGFSKKRNFSPEDEAGVCPLGNRFVYELRKGTDQELRTWSTSCSAKHGTFGGATSTVQQLFQNQIPDYYNISTTVVL